MKNHSITAILTALFLCVLWTLPASAEETLHLSDAAGLEALARRCVLDTASEGLEVILDCDIDLTGSDFRGIPTFSGSFDGGGHRITGFSLSGPGDVQGFFRYVEQNGSVHHLTVEGAVEPTQDASVLGGLVGINRGTVASCTFAGTVSGKNQVGGIAGRNEGTLTGCANRGSVTAERTVGGIAGQNLGVVQSCRNAGSVNEVEVSGTVSLDELEWQDLNSTSNVPVTSDIGGIAGNSAGAVLNCTNEGAVGYPHTGFNVGGVVGRLSGYLSGCTNSGPVQGRNDVGGIAGQIEPEMQLRYSQTQLDQLWSELDRLQSLMDAALNDADAANSRMNRQMGSVSSSTQAAKDNTTALSDSLTQWAQSSVRAANDTAAKLSEAASEARPALEQAAALLERMKSISEELRQFLEENELTEAEKAAVQEQLDKLDRAIADGNAALGQCAGALERLANGEDAFGDLLTGLADLTDAVQQGLDAVVEIENILQAARTEEPIATPESGAPDKTRLEELAAKLGALNGSMQQTAQALRSAAAKLSGVTAVQLPPVDSNVAQKGDALDSSLNTLIAQMNALNQITGSSGTVLINDFRAINQQMRRVTQTMKQLSEGEDEEALRQTFEDISDEGVSPGEAGCLVSSSNSGAVSGDRNTGGIVGALSVETDVDLEQDLTEIGDRSTEFSYTVSLVVLDCVNTGDVTCRKDNAGGIAGLMDFGLAARCQNYGDVASETGKRIGGIAGQSAGTVRRCWAKCTLSGERYLGGVAGVGKAAYDCHTMIDIPDGGVNLGTIAGDVDEDADLSGNTFVHDSLGAVDGITRAAQALPVSFEEMAQTEGVPQRFTELRLTFTANGSIVTIVPFQYGGGITSLPAIPPKEGHSAQWPELDYQHLTFSQTVEAVYTPYSSALADNSTLPNILVDGSFSAKAEIQITSEETSFPDESDAVHSGTAWTVTVNDPVMQEVSCTVHFRKPEPNASYRIWVKTGETIWQEQPHTVDGSYLLLPCDGNTITFLAEETPFPWR